MPGSEHSGAIWKKKNPKEILKDIQLPISLKKKTKKKNKKKPSDGPMCLTNNDPWLPNMVTK